MKLCGIVFGKPKCRKTKEHLNISTQHGDFLRQHGEIFRFQIPVLLSISTFGISDDIFLEHQMMPREETGLGLVKIPIGLFMLFAGGKKGCVRVYHVQMGCSIVAVWQDPLPWSSEVSWIPEFLVKILVSRSAIYLFTWVFDKLITFRCVHSVGLF